CFSAPSSLERCSIYSSSSGGNPPVSTVAVITSKPSSSRRYTTHMEVSRPPENARIQRGRADMETLVVWGGKRRRRRQKRVAGAALCMTKTRRHCTTKRKIRVYRWYDAVSTGRSWVFSIQIHGVF